MKSTLIAIVAVVLLATPQAASAPLAGPTTLVLDAFDRSNEDPLSQSANWAPLSIDGSGPSLEVLGQTAGHDEGDVHGDSYRSAEVPPASAEVYGEIAVVPADQRSMWLYLALQSAGSAGVDGYEARWFHWVAKDGMYLRKIVNGVSTNLPGSPVEIPDDDEEPKAGDVLLFRRVGTTLELWHRRGAAWHLRLTTSDGQYQGGRIGIGTDGTKARWDDFGGTGTTVSAEERSRGTCTGRGVHAIAASRCLSDPVNTLTGAFVTTAEDLAVPGTGVGFAWARTYTSSDPTVGRLGPGWTDSYSTSLAFEPDGDVRLRGEDGQIVAYARQPDGSFEGGPGSLSTLSAVAGGYELVRTDQVTYRFDVGGRLLSTTDRNGQGVTLSYDANGRLSAITDAAGRRATLAYGTSGLVTAVAAEDGRSIGYGYTDGRLTSFTDVRGKTWRYTYDAAGRLATIVDPLARAQVTNVYGADGRVERQTDVLGNATTFAWDAGAQTATVTDPNGSVWKDDYDDDLLAGRVDPLGHATDFAYDDDLNISGVTSPGGETTSLSHDARGNLVSATAPASLGAATKTFAYDERNNPTRVTDARGVATTYGHDARGNVVSIVQDGVQIASFTYDAAGRVLSSRDANGHTTTYAYDATGNLAFETDPLGNRTAYAYDGAGRVISRVDPKGVATRHDPADFTWRWTYDAAGHVLTERDPLGGVTTHAYDDAGREIASTDAKGRTTTFAYDAAGRLVSETRPDPDGGGPLPAPTTTYAYDRAGNRVATTDALGRTTTLAYDAANRVVTTTSPDPDGSGPLAAPVSTVTYDMDGNVASTVEPRGNAAGANASDFRTRFSYDAAGRLLTTTDPLGNATTNTYDSVGNLVSRRDANGHVTEFGYDGAGRILTVTRAAGGVTAHTYDAAGNRTTRTDANGRVTSYAYDAAGRLVRETLPDPDGPGPKAPAVTTHTYDANENLSSTVDPNGGRTVFAHDEVDRLVRIDYSDSTPDVTFAYDALGNRLSMTDGSGTETRTYDGLDRLTAVSRGSNTFAYDYDAVGNIVRRTYPGGPAIAYSHDALDRLTSVGTGGQTIGYAYDAASNLTTTTLPAGNGHVETRAYDRAGRLTEVSTRKGAATLASFVASLDPVGNPAQVVRSGVLAETQLYTYDANDRLVSVCFQAGGCAGGQGPFVRWTYDAVGNRLTEQRPTGTTSYAYDAADRLVQAGAAAFTYDQNGNQLSDASRTYAYDQANRLRTARSGQVTTTYSYDGDGVRLQSSTGTSVAETVNFLWDVNGPLPQLALERNGTGALLRQYVYGLRRISSSGSFSGTSYYHYDGLGSVAHTTSATGSTRWTCSYEPFGQIRTEQRSRDAEPTPFRFAGEYLDPTGLYHLRARQYDPGTGRFLARDPAEPDSSAPSIASYAYAANRPTVLIDPSGETFQPSDEGQDTAEIPTSIVTPDVSLGCQATLCGRARRVHPIPRRYPTWGGTLIHPTANLPGYPALDFGGREGTPVVAVEAGYVRRFGSANQGEALYLRGTSGVDYWYGHIRPSVSVGQRIRIGQVVGRTVRYVKPTGRADHLHLGANANVLSEDSNGNRGGSDNANDPAWKIGVAVMRQINASPRVG